MRSIFDPSELTAEQRRRELARILAAGVLRLRKLRIASSGAQGEIGPESAIQRLEVPAKTVLSVDTG